MSSDSVNLPQLLNLTTNGSSGPSTLINNTLNIPSYTGSGAAWGTITGTLSNQTDLNTALNAKLAKSSKTIFCIDNGDYASLQAAIDTVPANTPTTILLGDKTGGWGNITIPAGIILAIVGLNAPRGDQHSQVGSVTYSPSTGTQVLQNEVFLSNLYIVAPSGSAAITYGGTAPSRFRVFGCYVYGSNTTSILLSNSDASFSSFYLYDSYVDASSSSITFLQSSVRVIDVERCTFNTTTRAMNLTAGVITVSTCTLIGNAASEVITVSGTGTLLNLGISSINNSTTNGSGINIGTGAVCAQSNNFFAIATGTGYCVTGTGTHIYGAVNTTNSAAQAYNVKMKNTLTNLAMTLVLTSSA